MCPYCLCVQTVQPGGRWPLLERLEQHRLVPLLLDLVRVLPGEERCVCVWREKKRETKRKELKLLG